MPIKDIKDKIIESATKEKEIILQKANEEIRKIKDDSKKETEIIKKNITEQFKTDAELKEKRIITEAKLKANKDILAEKQSIIEELFNGVIDKIEKLDDKTYLSFMEKLILDNVEYGDENVYIGTRERKEVNKDFIEKINSKLKNKGEKGQLQLAAKNILIRGGVVLGTEEIRKNASIEILLDRLKEDIETELSQFLFKKDKQ